MRLTLRLFLAAFLLALPAIARARAISGIDGMTSTVMQKHQSSFSGLAVRLRLQSAQIGKDLELMPSIEYWRNSSTVQPFGIETMRKDATLGVDARYRFHVGDWHPYVGAGFGLHFMSTRVNAPTLGLDDATDSVVKGGLAGLGGLSFPLAGKVENFLELKYHHLPGYGQFKINWGLAYNF